MSLAKFSGHHPDAKRKSEWCQRPTLFAATFCKVFIVYRGVVQLQHDALFFPSTIGSPARDPLSRTFICRVENGPLRVGGQSRQAKKEKKNSPGNRLETLTLPPSLPSSHPPILPPARSGLPLIPLLPIPPLPPPPPPAPPTNTRHFSGIHFPLSFPRLLLHHVKSLCVCLCVCACVCMCVCVSFVCAAPGRLFPFRVEKVQSTASKFGRQLQIGRPSSERMQDSVTWRQLCPD